MRRKRLPVVGGRYVPLVSDRTGLQDKSAMESFVERMGWNAFVDMAAFKEDKELEELRAEYGETQKPYAEVVNMLAHIEVLQHNRQELQRMRENEKHKQLHLTKSRCI